MLYFFVKLNIFSFKKSIIFFLKDTFKQHNHNGEENLYELIILFNLPQSLSLNKKVSCC